jgi:hypothetical protein
MADDTLEKNIQIVPPTPDSNDNKDISWICSPEDKPTIESLLSALHSKYGEMFTQSQTSVPITFGSDSEDVKPDEADLQLLLKALQEHQTSDPEKSTPNSFDMQSLRKALQELQTGIAEDSAGTKVLESLLKSIDENLTGDLENSESEKFDWESPNAS